MTRQVTASAAMTLAVLMSSLDKNITQHNQEQQQNDHIWSNNPIITKYYSLKMLHGSCDDGNSHNLHTSYVLFNSIHSINGTDAQWNHHPQQAPHITAWVALLFIISDITFIFLRRWCLFRGVAPVTRILRVCIPGIHPSLWIIFLCTAIALALQAAQGNPSTKDTPEVLGYKSPNQMLCNPLWHRLKI